jgi:copper(I)-binding protein
VKAKASIARRMGIAVVAVSATLLTASCAAGQHAATANETPAIDGTSGQIGSIHLAAVALKAPAVSCYLPGADAALTLIIVNAGNADDTLANVSSPRFKSTLVAATADDAAAYTQANAGTGSCAAVPSGSTSSSTVVVAPSQPLPSPAGPQNIAAGESLQLGLTDTGTDTSTKPVVVLTGLTGGALYPGESIPVTFSFTNAGDVTLTVPVQLSVAPNNSTIPAGTDSAGE